MIPYNKKLVPIARVLRRNMTSEEKRLWYNFLKKLPYTVRRQHNIENYVVDFYIAEKKIVIEVDGLQHSLPQGIKSDAERDKALSSWGIKVLRYTNEEIRKSFNEVAEDILRNLNLNFSDINFE